MEIELVTETQNFWTSLKLSVMGRQQGLSWSDIGAMPVVSFFHTLKLTEKKAQAENSANNHLQKGSRAVRHSAKQKDQH